MLTFSHQSVLLNECINGLSIDPNGVYVDGTAGGAGHSVQIASRLKNGRLIAIDRDPDAVAAATHRLLPFGCAQVVQGNFFDIQSILHKLDIRKVNGILLDLGVSSYQLDQADRGFSYNQNAPLDMRMSKTGLSAKDIVNDYSLEALTKIIRDYGEEKFAYSIAKNILKSRGKKPIETTFDLNEIIQQSMPAKAKRVKNPCKRTYQALRIAVNGELENLDHALEGSFSCLDQKGRLVIITFHSLEDRIVKHKFKDWCQGCICPKDFPVCICNNKPKGSLINRKPILPSPDEQHSNRRSKSAKLRIFEKN